METRKPNGYIEQVPTPPNEWLTKLDGEDERQRLFGKKIGYKDGVGYPWDECTQEFYDEWQAKYNPQPEPAQETQQ